MSFDTHSCLEEVKRLGHLLYSYTELGLTRRESEIMGMIIYQWPIAKVATFLCREEKTINKHIENVKKKMACTSLFSLGIKFALHINNLQESGAMIHK